LQVSYKKGSPAFKAGDPFFDTMEEKLETTKRALGETDEDQDAQF